MNTNSTLLRSCNFLSVLALAGGLTVTGVRAQSNENLPAAEQVVEKFVKAIGGREAFLRLESQHMKGRYSMPAQGIRGQLEVFAAKPNKLLVKINMPEIGDISTGFNGEVAWVINAATGPMVLKGAQADQIREQADFYSVLHDPKNYEVMETLGTTDFEGKRAYQVKMVKKSGFEVVEYYDVKTGLLIGFTNKQESPFGTVNVTNVVEEYEKFGEVLLPTKVAQRMGPVEQVMTIESIEFNKVNPSTFDLPESVKALVEN